jgi:HrpA-like RNA helicase
LTSAEQAERAAQQSTPEILQSDLSGLVLDLLQWGCPDPASSPGWILRLRKPHRCAHLLTQLGALEGERLTARGQKMAALGNDPRLAAMLVAAQGMMKLPRRQNWRRSLRSRRAAAAAIWGRRFPAIRETGSSGRSSCGG